MNNLESIKNQEESEKDEVKEANDKTLWILFNGKKKFLVIINAEKNILF